MDCELAQTLFVQRNGRVLEFHVTKRRHLADGGRHFHRGSALMKLRGGYLQFVKTLALVRREFNLTTIHTARRAAVDGAVPVQLLAEAHSEFPIRHRTAESNLQAAIRRLS